VLGDLSSLRLESSSSSSTNSSITEEQMREFELELVEMQTLTRWSEEYEDDVWGTKLNSQCVFFQTKNIYSNDKANGLFANQWAFSLINNDKC
jgi:hypothetical protein